MGQFSAIDAWLIFALWASAKGYRIEAFIALAVVVLGGVVRAVLAAAS